jgi:hypothetical protein
MNVTLKVFMNKKLFSILFTLVTLLFSGCEALLDYQSIHKDYLAVYRATPQQRRIAEMRVRRYSDAVQRGKHARAKSRYIAVQTLDPDASQRKSYAQRRESVRKIAEEQGRALAPAWVEPNEIHCLMVFDTQSREFVGSDCYVVAALPGAGRLAQFEAVTAEFVGKTGVL